MVDLVPTRPAVGDGLRVPERLTGLVCLLVLAGGCATGSQLVVEPSHLEDQMRAAGAERTVVPYAVDDDMVQWARAAVPPVGDESQRLSLLAERLLAKDGLGIRYERDTTVTAKEVFLRGEANCLSFTHLFVGLARSLGMEVHFLEVRDLESYSREDDLVVHSDHIAVGFGPRHQLMIIDFAADQETNYRRIRPLSDVEATALYYSNRGAEQLRLGDLEGAGTWLMDAVRIAPALAPAWVNLGVVQRRSGMLDQAEASYRRALELDVAEYSAYQNLAALLRMTGRESEAYDLLALTDATQNRNPYTFLALGDLSARNGRLGEAERYYRRALRVQDRDAEPLAAMGRLALENGDRAAAERWLRKARRIDPGEHRVVLLEEMLRRGGTQGDGG